MKDGVESADEQAVKTTCLEGLTRVADSSLVLLGQGLVIVEQRDWLAAKWVVVVGLLLLI